MMQRILDIFLSAIALIFLSPLLLPVALILRFTGEGEIFFLQERVGKNGHLFKLYKFATMLKDSPNMGTGTVTMKDDARILPVGKLLRKTKINELPQLINILTGDMSTIGPRPQTQRCFDAFPQSAQAVIIKVRPGLSGIGSIIFRNEEQLMSGHENPDYFYDKVIMPYKGLLEDWYVNNQKISTYFILILITVWVVFFPKSSILSKFYKSKLPKVPDELAGKVCL